MLNKYATCVQNNVGDTKSFLVEIMLHRGSKLNLYIFALIMDGVSCEV